MLHAARQLPSWLTFNVRQNMTDYLQPAGRAWRIACFLGSVIAAALSAFGSGVLWTGMIREHSFTFDGKPLWVGAVIITAVGAAAAFIAVRLARGSIAPNGVTTMPLWFVQAFGVFLLPGVGLVAYDRRDPVFAVEGVFMCVAMILIGRNIARRKRKRPNQAVQPTPGSVTPRASEGTSK